MFQRFAIYYAPEAQTPLSRFAAAWFGSGTPGASTHAPRETLGLDDAVVDAATMGPSRYGLHATLKAPFRPAEGVHMQDVFRATASLARKLRRPPPISVEVGEIDGFLAIVAQHTPADLQQVADATVRELDPLRAPLSDEERQRREWEKLSPSERNNLENWGYPYVFDAYRFHITLTARMNVTERSAIHDALSKRLKFLTDNPFEIGSICVFGDPGGGRRFQLLDRFKLSA